MLGLVERTPWAPVANLASPRRDLDRFVGRVMGDTRRTSGEVFMPPAGITRDGDHWVIAMAIPGIAPEKVDIEAVGRTLRVQGQGTIPARAGHRVGPIVSELPYGRFARAFTLPDDIDRDHVEATYRHGMLELRLPLQERAKPRRIEVQTAPAATPLPA
jgi:HSP20 family protein